MIESLKAWRADIRKAERILKSLRKATDELRGINPYHVSTSFTRQQLTIAIGQLNSTVMDEKVKYRRETL